MDCPVRIRLVPDGQVARTLEPPSFLYRSPRGVTVEYTLEGLSGGDLLHLAVAGCVFNGLVRVSLQRGIRLTHAQVEAEGGFNEEGTRSTGIVYRVELAGDAPHEELRQLAEFVGGDASVPAIVQAGAPVSVAEITIQSSA